MPGGMPNEKEIWHGAKSAEDRLKDLYHDGKVGVPGGDEETAKQLNSIVEGGKKLFESLTNKKSDNGSEKYMKKKHDDRAHRGTPGSKFQNCYVNDKAVQILSNVHANLDDLLPKAELLTGMKILLTIPFVILCFLSALWGCMLFSSARRGYRPTFPGSSAQARSLQEPIMYQQNPYVTQGAMMVRPQDIMNTQPVMLPQAQVQPQYAVQYAGPTHYVINPNQIAATSPAQPIVTNVGAGGGSPFSNSSASGNRYGYNISGGQQQMNVQQQMSMDSDATESSNLVNTQPRIVTGGVE